MVTVFSTLQKLDIDENDFKFLATDDNGRYLYISTDYLHGSLSVRGQSDSLHLFMQELHNKSLPTDKTLELWLGVTEKEILKLDVPETEAFLDLYAMKANEDLFLNLMEVPSTGGKNIGEIIFLSYLAEIIRRGRD